MLIFRARYARCADFLTDHNTQLAQHGLFIRVDPPAELAQFAEVELIVELGEDRVRLPGQAVQIMPGAGVAVTFSPDSATQIAALVTRAETGVDAADQDPEFALVTEVDLAAPPKAKTRDVSVAPSKADKIQMALHGQKSDRLKIMRDNDKTLHMYLLKNPRLGLDELSYFAKTPTTAVEVLKAIAERREWYQRPEIALGLVRNPKTPVPIAVRMLDHISSQELRRLAKSSSARMPILQAARKKVIGKR